MTVLIILFASTQLGLHFWPISSLVYGIRIDYLSPTLYFLDLLIILYLALSKSYILNPKFLSILPILLTNMLFSQNPLSTLNWSLHLLLYCSFIFSLQADTIKIVPKILLGSLFFQFVLGLVQVFLGHSVGGLMYYLGERMVAVGSPGIATTSFMGQVVLRAYGTFSHPNILAGYAVISLLIILKLSPQFRSLRDSRRVIGTFVTTLIVFLTNSRSAALALFGLVIPLYLIQKAKLRLLYFSIFICSLFFVVQSPPRSDLSLSERLTLQGLSLSVTKTYPLFGTGANASISTYPAISPSNRLLQPDHNSPTLFFSWFGIFGVLAILQIISCTSSTNVREKCLQTLCSLGGLLPLLLLDHYLLTSPQGLFVLLLYFAIAVNYSHAQKNRQ